MAALTLVATSTLSPTLSVLADTSQNPSVANNNGSGTPTGESGNSSQNNDGNTSSNEQSNSNSPQSTPDESNQPTTVMEVGQVQNGQTISEDQANAALSSGVVIDTHTFKIRKSQVSEVINIGVQAGITYLMKKHPHMAVAIASNVAATIVSFMSSDSLTVTTMDLRNTYGGVTTVVKSYNWG